MKVSLDISVPSSLWRGLPRARAIARETIAAAAAESGAVREGVEVSLCLTDDAALRTLNSRWRGIDKPTNVLSFPSATAGGLGNATMLGDIVLCPEFAADQAAAAGHSLGHELALLTIHGVLHLLGYDHAEADEEKEMFALQRSLLEEWVADQVDAYHHDRQTERDQRLLDKSRYFDN